MTDVKDEAKRQGKWLWGGLAALMLTAGIVALSVERVEPGTILHKQRWEVEMCRYFNTEKLRSELMFTDDGECPKLSTIEVWRLEKRVSSFSVDDLLEEYSMERIEP